MEFEAIDIQNNEASQMIKIPESLKIDDSKAYIKKMGNCLYIIPFHQPWQTLFDSLNEFSPDFMEERNEPLSQTRESFD
jgi:antitoxin VapB